METIASFVSIIIIVFGILQIILFFKLWGMANDVKKLSKTDNIQSAIIEFAIGNEEKAKEIAYRNFVLEVLELYTRVHTVDQQYAAGFYEIETKYKSLFDNASAFIDFGKFSTLSKAKMIFKS